MAANERRGERTLKLGDRELTLVPDFENLTKLETALGRSVVDVIKQIPTSQNLPLGELAVIVYTLCEKPKPKLEVIGELILRRGFPATLLEVGDVLARGLAGEQLDEEEESDGSGKAEGDPS